MSARWRDCFLLVELLVEIDERDIGSDTLASFS